MRRTLYIVVIAAFAFFGYRLATKSPEAPDSAPAPPTSPAVVKAAQPSPAVAAAPVPSPATASPPPPAVRPPAPKLTLADIRQPAGGTPVKEVLVMLREGADQGIPQAACRLGAELIRCARVRDTLVMLGEAQAAAARAPKNSAEASRMSQYAGELSRALAENNRMCSGVAAETAQEAWRYLYTAAAAGNVAAMSRFVRDPGLQLNDPDATEGWSAYRQDAPAFLLGAIKGGDVRALYQAWVSAFSGQSAGGSGIFDRNPDKALQYGTAVVDLLDASRAGKVRAGNDRIAQEIGPERAAIAGQEGEKLRNAYFDHARLPNWGTDDGATEVADCWR